MRALERERQPQQRRADDDESGERREHELRRVSQPVDQREPGHAERSYSA
jgi:hypothetical protein